MFLDLPFRSDFIAVLHTLSNSHHVSNSHLTFSSVISSLLAIVPFAFLPAAKKGSCKKKNL